MPISGTDVSDYSERAAEEVRLKNKTTSELLRYVRTLSLLTPLEQELVRRIEERVYN